MHLNRTNLHPVQKTGDLLVREGLARKEDIDAALKIQARESESDFPQNHGRMPSLPRLPRNGRPPPAVEMVHDRLSIPPETPDNIRAAAGGEYGDISGQTSGGKKKIERTIGRILCDLDLVSPIDLSRVLKKYQKQLRLGDILLRKGVIDAQQLEDALYDQQLQLKPLGHMLIRKNRISMDQLYSALSTQYNIPYRKLEGFAIDPERRGDLTQIIGKNYAEENLILPLSLEGTKLTLAVYLPEKMMSIHELRTVYSYIRMACVLIQPDKFETLFAELYGMSIRVKTTDNEAPSGASSSEEKPEPKTVPPAENPGYETASEAHQIADYLIKHAINAGAASIHIEQNSSGTAIRYRINGLLKALNLPWLDDRLPRMTDDIVTAFKTMAGLGEKDEGSPQKRAFHVRIAGKENGQLIDFDLQLATCQTTYGETVTLRISDTPRIDRHLDDLQHAFHVLGPLKKVLNDARGILFFAEPPGTGKQTTLYAAASYLTQPEIKMIAIEETFQYNLPGVVQFQADPGRNLGAGALVRTALNHDPDVILLTNIPDPETASAAFDIAADPPFLMGGIIAEDAVDALLQLQAFGVRPGRIAQSLKGILAQQQVRKICSVCKERYIPEPDEWQGVFTHYPTDVSFFKAAGCTSCKYTGYDGFLVISEFLTIDNNLVAALEKGADPSALRRVAVESGFRSMAEDARLKLNRTTLSSLSKISARLFKAPEQSHGAPPRQRPQASGSPASPAASKGVSFRQKTWTLASLDPDSSVVDEMYHTYRVLKEQTGSRPDSNEIGLFREFITASFYHICRQYRCSAVTFSIENKPGPPEITATPVRTGPSAEGGAGADAPPR